MKKNTVTRTILDNAQSENSSVIIQITADNIIFLI